MTKALAVEKILVLLEAYYGVKYRGEVRNDLRDYLCDKGQNMAVALYEKVKLKHPTQYREPPCPAIFETVYWKNHSDLMSALENNGEGIRLKSLLEPVRKRIEEAPQREMTEEESAELDKRLEEIKKKFR